MSFEDITDNLCPRLYFTSNLDAKSTNRKAGNGQKSQITQGASHIEREPSSVEGTTTESKGVPDYICKTCGTECKGVEFLISNSETSKLVHFNYVSCNFLLKQQA